jgi:putative aminopeptidase FrvX
MELLKQLTEIRGVSGDESLIKDFIIDYVSRNAASWKVQPKVIFGDGFQVLMHLNF